MRFGDAFIDIACPRCGYILAMQLADARLQRRVFCPACKLAIQLVDQDARLSTGLDALEDAVNEVSRQLGGSR